MQGLCAGALSESAATSSRRSQPSNNIFWKWQSILVKNTGGQEVSPGTPFSNGFNRVDTPIAERSRGRSGTYRVMVNLFTQNTPAHSHAPFHQPAYGIGSRYPATVASNQMCRDGDSGKGKTQPPRVCLCLKNGGTRRDTRQEAKNPKSQWQSGSSRYCWRARRYATTNRLHFNALI
jgi:hypothetical protein